MTKVIAIINAKGGVGKTTVSTHLAVAAERLGLVTAILDLDPQPSSTLWKDQRSASSPAVVPAQAARLPVLLKQAHDRKLTLSFSTRRPGLTQRPRPRRRMPTSSSSRPQPKPVDLMALPQTVQLARAAGKPFFVVLNDAPVIGTEVTEARAALTPAGIEVAPTVLHSRKAYYSHMQAGQTASDFDPEGKAAAEVRALMLWVCERVNLLTSIQAGIPETTEAITEQTA